MNKSIVFFYSELGPYNIPVLRCLYQEFGFNVHVVRWDVNCLKPYEPPKLEGVLYYKRSEQTLETLTNLLEYVKPSLIYVSGWMDKLYLNASYPFKRLGVPVVSGFDDIWIGSIRQRLGTLYFKIYLHKFFSHAWVAGEAQFEFAKRLGFSRKNIIYDLLSADVEKFTPKTTCLDDTGKAIKKRFLYVGNFKKVKGTDILAEAFQTYREELLGTWDLLCIGNGELKFDLENIEGLDVLNYASQDALVEYANQSNCFILPSRHDQWGVVVHEFATIGLPLILSEGVGASSKFLINGGNGLVFENESVKSLANAMLYISSMNENKLNSMSNLSLTLAKRISPFTSTSNLVSIIKEVR